MKTLACLYRRATRWLRVQPIDMSESQRLRVDGQDFEARVAMLERRLHIVRLRKEQTIPQRKQGSS